MKRLIVAIMFASLVVLSTVTIVYAARVAAVGLAISFISDDCSGDVVLYDGSRYFFEGTYKVVNAKNPGGNILFQCKGKLTDEGAPPPKKAIRANSDRPDLRFVCWDGTNFVGSDNWWIDITPSGNAMYKCHVNPSR